MGRGKKKRAMFLCQNLTCRGMPREKRRLVICPYSIIGGMVYKVFDALWARTLKERVLSIRDVTQTFLQPFFAGEVLVNEGYESAQSHFSRGDVGTVTESRGGFRRDVSQVVTRKKRRMQDEKKLLR